jgi:hypothetical protein
VGADRGRGIRMQHCLTARAQPLTAPGGSHSDKCCVARVPWRQGPLCMLLNGAPAAPDARSDGAPPAAGDGKAACHDAGQLF